MSAHCALRDPRLSIPPKPGGLKEFHRDIQPASSRTERPCPKRCTRNLPAPSRLDKVQQHPAASPVTLARSRSSPQVESCELTLWAEDTIFISQSQQQLVWERAVIRARKNRIEGGLLQTSPPSSWPPLIVGVTLLLHQLVWPTARFRAIIGKISPRAPPNPSVLAGQERLDCLPSSERRSNYIYLLTLSHSLARRDQARRSLRPKNSATRYASAPEAKVTFRP